MLLSSFCPRRYMHLVVESRCLLKGAQLLMSMNGHIWSRRNLPSLYLIQYPGPSPVHYVHDMDASSIHRHIPCSYIRCWRG